MSRDYVAYVHAVSNKFVYLLPCNHFVHMRHYIRKSLYSIMPYVHQPVIGEVLLVRDCSNTTKYEEVRASDKVKKLSVLKVFPEYVLLSDNRKYNLPRFPKGSDTYFRWSDATRTCIAKTFSTLYVWVYKGEIVDCY